MKYTVIIALSMLLLMGNPVKAQDVSVSPSGLDVEIAAQDGKKLYGSYFAVSDSDGPAVLLLHQLYTNRSSWSPLVQPLLDAGYKVLAIDLRGYGKTRGKINWELAQDDTVAWGNWLKSQAGVQSISIIGSSMGSNLALNGCAAIEGCSGAVVISPSLNYFGVKTADAMQSGFPILIIYADNDRYPKQDVPQMLELGRDYTASIVYTGRTHGMNLFDEHDDLPAQIIKWLQSQ